jgi:hypothetical protein
VGLIFLDGGPLNGNAYDTKDLLGAPESALPRGYVWSSERRTSPRTGKTAQVWKYVGDGLPPQQSPSAQTTATVEPDDDINEGAYLRRRREAVKASRKRVCELAELTSSRLVAIEAGTGKSITDEERARLSAALDRLHEARP